MASIEKTEARRQARTILSGLDPAIMTSGSQAAADLFRSLPEYAEADLVLAFLSMPGEIETEPLVMAALGEGKPIAAPRIEGGDLAFVRLDLDQTYRSWPRDRYGIPAPPADRPAYSFDELGRLRVLVAAPGLAFDHSGGRLGRGKGFYDRFLRAARLAASKGGGRLVVCGYALAEQLVEAVPSGPDDEVMEMVVAGGTLARIRPIDWPARV